MAPTAAELLRQARRDGFAVAALNAMNLETAEAIVQGAEYEHTPVIVQVSENAARYSSLTRLAAIARTLKSEASVPVVLHFDHAESLESARRAIDAGFDSVMLEVGAADEGRYAEAVQALVKAAHARGAAVEAEVEAVRKGDRGSGDRLDPESVLHFAETTECDWIAIEIGTEHKQTRKEARLDLERLTRIAEIVPQPLVLHGSSGVPDEELRAAVASGIAKVNVSTALSLAFTQGARDSLRDESIYDPRTYLGAARTRMTDEVRAYIRRLGGAGRADAFK